MQQVHSTSSSLADLPYPNTFNTHCDICSHPIAQSDINILQPCFCGPFHSYCITNLELQARNTNPNNLTPHLSCPRCHLTVTAITFNLVDHIPRATRPPFTTNSATAVAPPAASSPIPCPQPSQLRPQTLLPTAIHDIRPSSPTHAPENPKLSPYPKPTTPILPKYSPSRVARTAYYTNHESASFPPYPTYPPSNRVPPPPPLPPPTVPVSSSYHPSQPHHTNPTAPPIPQHDPLLPQDLYDCFPAPSQDFRPQPSNKSHKTSASPNRRRYFSSLAPESRRKPLLERRQPIVLPSPHNVVPPSPKSYKSRRREHSGWTKDNLPKNFSPNTIVIRKHVSGEDVRKELCGDDVYKAYVEGKARVLQENPSEDKRQPPARDVKVKIEMDVHVFHHYKSHARTADAMRDRSSAKDKERRKTKPAEKSWWKSPRSVSLLDARERRYREGRTCPRATPPWRRESDQDFL